MNTSKLFIIMISVLVIGIVAVFLFNQIQTINQNSSYPIDEKQAGEFATQVEDSTSTANGPAISDNPLVIEKDYLRFMLNVPPTTPEDDAIILHYWPESELRLSSIGNNQFMGEIKREEFFKDASVQPYTYTRGGMNMFGEKGEIEREIDLGTFSPIEDTIQEWKWLPSEQLNEEDTVSLAGKKDFKIRNEFWKGVQFVDFWNPAFPYQYNSTVNHLKRNGYTWIEIAPPWDIKSHNPPVISGTGVNVPTFPEDKLREHIKFFKDAGFKVALRIQVCCTPLRVYSGDEWWSQLFDTYESFVKFHADLAKEEGVDALLLSHTPIILPLHDEAPYFASERWKQVIQVAKASNAKVGFETFVDDYTSKTWDLPPEIQDADFLGNLDFIGVSLGGGLTTNPSPTQDDYDNGMNLLFKQIDAIHEKSGKPIVLTGVYYETHKGAGMLNYDSDEDVSVWAEPEEIKTEYNSEIQAMIYESLMRQIADRNYIQGIFPFGYWYLDAPLTLGPSIRAKMSERILVKWFKYAPD